MRLNWAAINLNTVCEDYRYQDATRLELMFCFPQRKIREGRGGENWEFWVLKAGLTRRVCFPADRPRELLLRVQMGIPGERDYYDSTDLVWDISKECTAWALRQRVASHYCLPVDKIEIAKYFPDRFEWLPISSWVRSGMTESKCCLRQVCVGL